LKEKINNERNYPIADQRLYLNNQELQSSQMISDALKGSAVSTPYGRHGKCPRHRRTRFVIDNALV